MRAGVLQLDRWGLLERVVAAGTPPVVGTTFHYADRSDPVELAQPLYAPRRTCSNAMLVRRPGRPAWSAGSGSTSPACCATTAAGSPG